MKKLHINQSKKPESAFLIFYMASHGRHVIVVENIYTYRYAVYVTVSWHIE